MIDPLYATLLGIIQGLSEFIPISSTAHLRIIPALMGREDPGAAYSAVIQLGTLVSLLIYFRKDLITFTIAAWQGIRSGDPWGNLDSRMVWFMVLGTIPISVVGLLLSSYITGPFRSLYVIGGSLIALAIILWIADRMAPRNKEIDSITWKDVLWIGIAQCFALVPGASRSGTTLTAGLILGYTREASMRISFLLSIPAIALSGFYELIKEREHLAELGFSGLLLGTIVSGVVGYIAVAGLLRFLRTHTTLSFVIYRILAGVTIYILLHFGFLQDSYEMVSSILRK